jgi:hypothetical protein
MSLADEMAGENIAYRAFISDYLNIQLYVK